MYKYHLDVFKCSIPKSAKYNVIISLHTSPSPTPTNFRPPTCFVWCLDVLETFGWVTLHYTKIRTGPYFGGYGPLLYSYIIEQRKIRSN